jgi:DNA mismatch endonuclease (patch repair protein)
VAAGEKSWASSPAIRRTMQSNRGRDTGPEIALRSALHQLGLRFRKNLLIRTASGVKVRPDVVFTKARVAIFVDGCFWHCCPDHATTPRRNGKFWRAKLQANVNRDRRVDQALSADGWQLLRVWEHESPIVAAASVKAMLDSHPISAL